jgi:hypothetical protein
MLHSVALIRTDVSVALSASFIRVTRIGELGTTLAVTSNRYTLRRNTKLRSVCRLLVTASVFPSSPILVTLMTKAQSSSETSVLTRPTWHNIPEDTILQLSSLFTDACHPNEGGAKFLRSVLFLQESHGITSQRTPFFSIVVIYNYGF